MANIVCADNFSYYNLSEYNDDETIMDFYFSTDKLMQGGFVLFLVACVWILSIIGYIKNDRDPLEAIHLGSLYGLLFALILYIGGAYFTGVSKPGMYLFIPGITYAVTLALTWYQKK